MRDRDKKSKSINGIFGDIKTLRFFDRLKREYALQFPAIVARALHSIGIPYGKKTEQNYSLPRILTNGSLQMQRNLEH